MTHQTNSQYMDPMVIDFHTHPYLYGKEFLNFYPECFTPSPAQCREDLERAGISMIDTAFIDPHGPKCADQCTVPNWSAEKPDFGFAAAMTFLYGAAIPSFILFPIFALILGLRTIAPKKHIMSILPLCFWGKS